MTSFSTRALSTWLLALGCSFWIASSSSLDDSRKWKASEIQMWKGVSGDPRLVLAAKPGPIVVPTTTAAPTTTPAVT
eukprot:CAMPEP_0206590438 /NCGR_PEP_ID=MMETSP0325_2-20121206/39626_1 /ASSEMBLY_ACC=CAM_ASM_000347 /TAXON_ID=2866 /ORGANISM="Crypthecodinium cohnii, Strain Seligo" /LENGTH=76 /DNA_ID=CAMNT_0054099403 /DNA_START=59 /DNA_END=286 /DNA_ORIENTATION=+